MAEQRIAPGPRIAPIPIPQQRASLAEGANDLIEAAQGAYDMRQETDRRIADSQWRIAERQREADEAALSASQGAAFARMQTELTLEIEQLKQQGVNGHEQRVRALVDQKLRAFDAGFGNSQTVRQRFMPNMADVAGRFETREGLWAIGERAKLGAVQIDGMVQELANGLQLDPSPKNYSAAMASSETALRGQGLPESALSAAMAKRSEVLTGAMVDGMLAAGQTAQVRALLESGFFNDKLPDVDRLRARIDNADATAAREAELAQSRARQIARDGVDLLEAKVKAGIVPTSAEIAQTRAAASAAGLDPAELFDLAVMDQKVAINRQYQGRDVTVLLHDQAALGAKMAAGSANESEQLAYRQIGDLIDAREKETAQRYKGLLSQGTPGRVQIVNDLQRLPPDARFRQAQQVEPGLGYVAMLADADQRSRAINGRAERKADKKLAPAKDIDPVFAATIGRARIGISGEHLQGIKELAADLYAHAHRTAGGDENFNPGLYRNMVSAALGRTRRRDGTPQGGIGQYGDAQVILPDNRTQDEFNAAVARNAFAKATYDGRTPVDKRDALRRFIPVYMGELPDGRTRYRFVDGGGRELKGQGGGTYVLEIGR